VEAHPHPWWIERRPRRGGRRIAHGADGGGSLRIPAAFCGLFTLKPTRGVLPNNHGADANRCFYTDGPLASTALDAAAMLDVLAGREAPAELTQAARKPPPSLKICVWALGAPGTDPQVDFERFVPFAVSTAPFNVSGQPAASVPVGLTTTGCQWGCSWWASGAPTAWSWLCASSSKRLAWRCTCAPHVDLENQLNT
jgi:Asp-tRNA(Asn)/Glu-tRNA(Gln) amidotransferase A subunit family amidase